MALARMRYRPGNPRFTFHCITLQYGKSKKLGKGEKRKTKEEQRERKEEKRLGKRKRF